jgi:2-polyprenyl-6-methoxyphenol hydroxylase-like FAD-dependent oxidoreductase
MTVLIVGGGIGGLTTALSLHQIGVDVRVFESVPEIRPLGVGINVLPHAVRELTELGLQDELAVTGIPTRALSYFSKLGQAIWSEPRGKAAGYNWPQFSIHRGELQMLLFRAAQDRIGHQNILRGHHLSGWEETNDGVRAKFIDAATGKPVGSYDGTLLIGADGIHSVVRSTFYPNEGAPIWNGAILWRGVSESAPFLDGRTMVMAGHEHQKFVCYPISRQAYDDGKSTTNWIAERKFTPDHEWRREDWNRAGKTEDFLPWFESWKFDWLDVPGLIRNAKHVFEYPMVDRDPLPKWTHGRATLLGDAAHPMYPIGSNGASQAILDARVLTREIQRLGATSEAAVAYEEERRPATAKIVAANRANGPDQVLEVVEQRAPDGFEEIADVLSPQELEDIAANYKRLAGFDKDTLNARPPIVATATAAE